MLLLKCYLKTWAFPLVHSPIVTQFSFILVFLTRNGTVPNLGEATYCCSRVLCLLASLYLFYYSCLFFLFSWLTYLYVCPMFVVWLCLVLLVFLVGFTASSLFICINIVCKVEFVKHKIFILCSNYYSSLLKMTREKRNFQ